jgi:endonuclease/exonuclease/phosphatase family metal-dependent hydrolase
MSYNLLNFGNITSYCTEQNNNYITKTGYLRTIIENQQPDILAVCELKNSTQFPVYILGNALNVNGETRWARTDFTNIAGSPLVNCLFYDKNKFIIDTLIPAVTTSVRDINIYRLKHKNSGTYFHVVIAHLKAGSTDAISRGEMVTAFMNRLNQYHDKTNNFIIVGDFNVYSSAEPAFQNLINPTNNEIAFFDPINKIGAWNNNNTYKNYFTQSTHNTESNGCAASGGFDDRFDFILLSSSILNNTKKMKYINNSYWAVGQDGNRFNNNLISPDNTTLPSDVINALYNMSDHLPVVAEFQFENITNIESSSTNNQFYVIIQNPIKNQLNFNIKIDSPKQLTVSLYSIVGNKIIEKNIFAEQNFGYSFDINNLKSGIYILIFEGDGIFKSYKIMIEQ